MKRSVFIPPPHTKNKFRNKDRIIFQDGTFLQVPSEAFDKIRVDEILNK